jgi:uncharacterized protein (TIGR03083 family)
VTALGDHYRNSRERLTALLAARDEAEWGALVAACPGWDVHDVIAHLVGVIEDGLAGRLTGPPDEVLTAEEVARHRDDAPADLLARWAELAPPFEAVVTDRQIVPAVLDVVSHEHDIRAAVDRPGARDDEMVLLGARRLVGSLDVAATVTVDLGGERVSSPPVAGPAYTVRATAFEVLRFRLGRRSRDQVAALAWSADPEPILDDLFVFGPAALPLAE